MVKQPEPLPYGRGSEARLPSRACKGAVPQMMAHGRILALDLGKKRIGMAISDELGITAQGIPTLERRNKRMDFAALARSSTRTMFSRLS